MDEAWMDELNEISGAWWKQMEVGGGRVCTVNYWNFGAIICETFTG